MQQLDLDQAEVGMVLGEHAFGRRGQLLLSAGTVLNDRHLQMLRANAVERISVGPMNGGVRRAARSPITDVDAHIEARFCLCDGQHPLIDELRRLCRQRLNPAQGEHEDD